MTEPTVPATGDGGGLGTGQPLWSDPSSQDEMVVSGGGVADPEADPGSEQAEAAGDRGLG